MNSALLITGLMMFAIILTTMLCRATLRALDVPPERRGFPARMICALVKARQRKADAQVDSYRAVGREVAGKRIGRCPSD